MNFEGGLKEGALDWSGDWIRVGWRDGAPLLRKSFEIEKPVSSAMLRVTALGVCEARINGEKVGEDHLLPGWTDYRKRVYFHPYDVAASLRQGENVLGGLVAPGWFAGFFGPFGDKGYYGHVAWFSCVLEIEYADGSCETIQTDSSWRGSEEGPVLEADLLMGESYDARKEIPEWDAPGFDDGEWTPVALIDENERLPEKVEPYPGTSVRTVAELPAQAVSEPHPGTYLFDLGQNMVGVVRLRIDVPVGTEIVIRHGEMLKADGSLYTENLRAAKAVDRYIAKGGGEEVWQPSFTFHGFRYVELSGLPSEPGTDAVTGVVWMSALEETATFQCSDEKVNQLFSNIQWGFRGNYLDVPTDCPQRDERLGWTGDTQIFMKSATFLADVREFFDKWLQDLHDAQRADGAYPDIAPTLGRLGHGHTAWADAGIICPFMLWQTYGEIRFAKRWWSEMCRYMDFLFTDGNIHNGPDAVSYGDWLSVGSETPNEFIGHAYRLYDCRLMKEMAGALGKEDEVQRFAGLEEKARALFIEKFVGADGHLAVKTQTAYALVVAMGLFDGEPLSLAAEDLAENIRRNRGYLSTGFVGVGYLCPALSKCGHHDLAVQLLLNEDYPSWLYEVNNGATTVWERWNSWSHEHGFGDVSMNSFNHYAFGAVFEWMFESLAGIKAATPGFQTLEVSPGLTDRFDFVKASFESPQGRISIHWKKTETGFEVELETPVATTVRVGSDEWPVTSGQWRLMLSNGKSKLEEIKQR